MTRDDLNKTLQLIYPEDRTITVREVLTWAKDRMADSAIDVESLRAGAEGRTLSDEDIDRIAQGVETPTLVEAIERLEDDGVATFRNRKF
jgi:hypothetical protein